MPETIECPRCGAVYEVTYTKIAFRDRDTANCDVCGEQIDSWNGSNLPSHKLIARGSKSPAKETDSEQSS